MIWGVKTSTLWLGVVMVAALSADWRLTAQTPSAAEATAAKWYAYYRRRAAEDYELSMGKGDASLVLREPSILNWTNPLEDGQINGSTFLWERNGRPYAVGQLFSYVINDTQRSLCHVFATLSDESLTGRRDRQVFWTPRQEPSGWREAAMFPAPERTWARRLIQMRDLARQVEAYTEEATRGKRSLRLLPQPLFRYDASVEDADGGLFAYVVGNDPELLLLVECLLTPDARWRFRFVQSTRSTTVATWKDREIYRYDGAQNPQSPTAIYLSQHGVERIPRILAKDEPSR